MATPVAAQSGRPSEGKASVGKAARQAGDKRSRAAAQPERRRSAPSRKAQRERWNKLPADRRKEMQRIYSRLNELPPDKRTRLLERLRNLDADARREKIRRAKKQLESDDNPIERQSRRTRRRMFERLPRQVRERLRTLPPRERQKHVQQHFAKRRAALIGELPPRVANEVRKLPPEKQAQRLRQYRTNQAFGLTFRDREEVKNLRQLPRRELLRLLRVNGEAPKPPFLSRATWERWKRLKPYERERLLRFIRGQGSVRRRPPPRREQLQRGGSGAPGRAGPRTDTRKTPSAQRRAEQTGAARQ